MKEWGSKWGDLARHRQKRRACVATVRYWRGRGRTGRAEESNVAGCGQQSVRVVEREKPAKCQENYQCPPGCLGRCRATTETKVVGVVITAAATSVPVACCHRRCHHLYRRRHHRHHHHYHQWWPFKRETVDLPGRQTRIILRSRWREGVVDHHPTVHYITHSWERRWECRSRCSVIVGWGFDIDLLYHIAHCLTSYSTNCTTIIATTRATQQ